MHDIRQAIQQACPAWAKQADDEYHRWRREDEAAANFSPGIWLEYLAGCVNRHLQQSTDATVLWPLFLQIARQLPAVEARNPGMIDNCFTEYLFYGLSAEQARPGWKMLPSALRKQYLDFHHKPPC